MTTKVTITLTQKHMPVIVEIVRDDGSVSYTQTLTNLGDSASEYVHSGQTLKIHEMSTQNLFDILADFDDPPSCPNYKTITKRYTNYQNYPKKQTK